ncbi:MAG: hypothetical protein KAT11_08070 [Phycisphaerae bacterium]|nr:hypothetical protein [Phycisphaerae bacterium]
MKPIVALGKSHRAFAILSLAFVISLAGCKQNSSKPEVPDKLPTAGIIRITPSELFTGELKKIEPHLASTNGCVRIEYAGPKTWFKDRIVIWQNGQARDISAGESLVKEPLDGNMSFSLHDVSSYNDELGYKFILAGPAGSTSTMYLPKCDELGESGSNLLGSYLKLSGPVEIPDDEEVAVWGYCWRPGGEWDRSLSIEEQAMRSKWAVVVMVSIGK